MAQPPFRIVFALFPGMTQLDFTGPHQFLSRLPGAEVILCSACGGAVTAEGLTFADTRALAGIDACDLLCVPGGVPALEAALDSEFIGGVRRLGLGARYVTSVCTGSLILGAAGLLVGRRAACHWAWRHLLSGFGAIPDTARVVRDGNVITGGGVTAGIDFALAVLAEVGGPDLAQLIQLGLEYAPAPPFAAGSPDCAPPAIVTTYLARFAPILAAREGQATAAVAAMKQWEIV